MAGGSVAQVCTTWRASLDANGAEIANASFAPGISPSGRFISFQTRAALLPNDQNGVMFDLYMIDTAAAVDSATGGLELISVDPSGFAANLDTGNIATFSLDGRYVAFRSSATNIVPGLSNQPHMFVRDRTLGQTVLASVSSSGIEGDVATEGKMTPNGRFVLFACGVPAFHPGGDFNGLPDVYLRDLQTSLTHLISINLAGKTGNQGAGVPFPGDVSDDGRFVAFNSESTNLVAGDTNGVSDVFRRDRSTGITQIVSRSSSGQLGNGWSGWGLRCSSDGRFVAFASFATNLVPGDTNAKWDIFVRDCDAGTTERVTVDSAGMETGYDTTWCEISGDGRYVVFETFADNLVPQDTNGWADVFRHDRLTRRTERVNLDTSGVEANLHYNANSFVISEDAGHIAFQSPANNMIANDFNGAIDIFLRECSMPTTYCTAKTNSLGCVPAMTSDGVPMASWPQDYYLRASQILNQKSGMLIYSTANAAALPFHGGTLCMLQPIHRTPPQQSGGSTTGSDCTGAFAFDFNAWIATGTNPALVAGASVWAQYWSRDPGFAPPNNASLTDATTFVIWP